MHALAMPAEPHLTQMLAAREARNRAEHATRPATSTGHLRGRPPEAGLAMALAAQARRIASFLRQRLDAGGVRDEEGQLIGLEQRLSELADMLAAVLARDENQSALLVGPR